MADVVEPAVVAGDSASVDDDDDASYDDADRGPRRGHRDDDGDAGGGDAGGAAVDGSQSPLPSPGAAAAGDGSAATAAPLRTLAIPENARYFLAKPRNHFRLVNSIEKQVWSTRHDNAATITEAFEAGTTAVVFFSVNMSQHLQVGAADAAAHRVSASPLRMCRRRRRAAGAAAATFRVPTDCSASNA
jgi:hypothetical protein